MELAILNEQYKFVKSNVEAVKLFAGLNSLSRKVYIDYDISSKQVFYSYYAGKINHSKQSSNLDVVSVEALRIQKDISISKADRIDYILSKLDKTNVLSE